MKITVKDLSWFLSWLEDDTECDVSAKTLRSIVIVSNHNVNDCCDAPCLKDCPVRVGDDDLVKKCLSHMIDHLGLKNE